jgi:hypothetical protein
MSVPRHRVRRPADKRRLAGSVAVVVIVAIDDCMTLNERLLRQLCAVSLTTTMPDFFFDTTLPSVTRACGPGSSETELPPSASDEPEGDLAPRLNATTFGVQSTS